MGPLTPEAGERRLRLRTRPIGLERVPLEEAPGRVAGATVRSPIALPAFDSSAVDGYAVTAGLAARRQLMGRVYAGDPVWPALGPDETVFVATGAMVPPDAGVARQEDVRVVEDREVVFRRLPPSGENVRRAGRELSAGAVVLQGGERLGPGQMALLRSLGVASLRVRRRVAVTVLSVGSELRESGRSSRGMVRNTNGPWLAQQLSALGCLVSQRTLADDEAQFRSELSQGLAASDLVLSTGGASQGPRDFVRRIGEAMGLTPLIDGVGMRPGQPLQAFSAARALWIALPGNPLATAIGFDRLVRPTLAAMERRAPEARPERARLAAAIGENRAPVLRYLPASAAIREGWLEVTPAASVDSGAVSALRGLGAWIRMEPGQAALATGSEVAVWLCG